MGSPRNGQSEGMRRQRGRKEGRPRGGVRGLRGCKRVGRASGTGEPVSPPGATGRAAEGGSEGRSPGQGEWGDRVRGKRGIPAVREPGPRGAGSEGTWEMDLRGPGVRGVGKPA